MKVTKVNNTNVHARLEKFEPKPHHFKGEGIVGIDWNLPKHDGEITDFRSEEMQRAIERAELKNYNNGI